MCRLLDEDSGEKTKFLLLDIDDRGEGWGGRLLEWAGLDFRVDGGLEAIGPGSFFRFESSFLLRLIFPSEREGGRWFIGWMVSESPLETVDMLGEENDSGRNKPGGGAPLALALCG